jgi:hypothetical protein
MIVKELIEQLQQLDPELHVFVDGYEGGYDDVVISEVKDIALDVNNDWWYGVNDNYDETKHITNTVVKGIVL